MSSYGSVPNQVADVESEYQSCMKNEIDDSIEKMPVPVNKKRLSIAILLFLSSLIFLLGFAGYSNYDKLFSAETSLDAKTLYKEYPETASTIAVREDSLSIYATNEYGHFEGPYPWMKDVPGTQLVEPFKTTLLTLSGQYVDAGNYYFNWIIQDYDTTSWDISKQTQSAVFKQPGVYDVQIQIINKSDNTVEATYRTRFICRFVKRELRKLTIDDRNRVLDAMAAVWEYSQEDGEAKYGAQFTSIATLVGAHSLASNDIMCDQFHEGTGFLTHHLALALVFEASIRAVDPSVTLPYWDFTIEGQKISELGQKPSYMMNLTPVFTSDYFGSVGEDHRILDGRWAHRAMPKQSDAPGSIGNSYGYIRSYWNNNPDPEISRMLFGACGVEPEHKKIPSCKEHYAVLNSKSFGSFQTLSPADGHGPMHVQIGGMWGGCNEAYHNFTRKWDWLLNQDMTDDEIAAIGYKKWKWGNSKPRKLMVETAIMGEYFHIYRSLWRSHMCAVDGTPNLLECPEKCDSDTPFEECKCQVTALLTGETTWENLFPCLLNSEDNRHYFQAAMPTELIKDLIYMVSTASVQEGEMIESASPADPMFWIIHPCIERLLQAKRLPGVDSMGGTTFYKWPVVDGSNETWLEYSYYTFDAGENPYFTQPYKCYGHSATDKLLPTRLPFTETPTSYIEKTGGGTITNWDFYLALDPNILEANDYVFDHFNWDHCDGVDVSS